MPFRGWGTDKGKIEDRNWDTDQGEKRIQDGLNPASEDDKAGPFTKAQQKDFTDRRGERTQ